MISHQNKYIQGTSFEIAAFYFGKKRGNFLCMPAAAGGVVGPCTEKLSFVCTQALLRASVLFGGIFGSKRSGREGAELADHALCVCTMVEPAVNAASFGAHLPFSRHS